MDACVTFLQRLKEKREGYRISLEVRAVLTRVFFGLLSSGLGLLSSDLVALSVEQRTIKSEVRGFDSRRGRRVFSLSRAISRFLTRANAQWDIPGFTLAL